MKYFYIGMMILCLLLTGCLAAGWVIGRSVAAVSLPLRGASDAIRSGDEARGQALIRQAAAEWSRREGVLASLLRHDLTDEIGTELSGLQWSRGTELLRSCAKLLEALRSLADSEKATWRNIF